MAHFLFASGFKDSTQFKKWDNITDYAFLKITGIESQLVISNLSSLLKVPFYKSKDKIEILTLVLLRIL